MTHEQRSQATYLQQNFLLGAIGAACEPCRSIEAQSLFFKSVGSLAQPSCQTEIATHPRLDVVCDSTLKMASAARHFERNTRNLAQDCSEFCVLSLNT